MSRDSALPPMEMWGGVECTVNRVGELWLDQLARSGHDRRISDLDLFADLGIRTLRQPFLWEKIAPGRPEDGDWAWARERLRRLCELGIRPVAGLIHHGSGPAGTSLVQENFAPGLAAYAREFAMRFPDVDCYTPVNEPLTTARFSGLYGVWYPHGRDDRTFIRTLLNQCLGVVLCMREIRKINPRARLIQTEDMGRVSSTEKLAQQADFENERRWLSLDLLCGRVTPEHSMWDYLLRSGAEERELRWFAEHPCPPDIVGINHYVLSNRHLDHHLRWYPKNRRGGNGRQAYADMETVRVGGVRQFTLEDILLETWERYHIPIAVTENHLDCTREEQVRWLADCWRLALAARGKGADVRALTAWGLLGHYDWRCLVTRDNGCYESGVFDMSSGAPRPTALAFAVKKLAAGELPEHPVLEVPGWWRRDSRILYPPPPRRSVIEETSSSFGSAAGPFGKTAPLLIAAGDGSLGAACARVCERRGLPYRLLDRRFLDAADPSQVEAALSGLRPWAVIHAADSMRVKDAERDAGRCFRENVVTAVNLARGSEQHGIPCLSFSSDLVFDGKAETPYHELCPTGPQNVYGESKVQAEREMLRICPEALIIRTGALFGPWDNGNFLVRRLNRLHRGETALPADDATVSLTYIPDLVDAGLDLLLDKAQGLWHLVNEGETSRPAFIRTVAKRARLKEPRGIRHPAPPFTAGQPAYRVLTTQRGRPLPPLDDAAARFVMDFQLTN